MLRILAWTVFYIAKLVLAIIPTSLVALWAIPYATIERGYSGAIGGEWILIIGTFCLAYWYISKKAEIWLYTKEKEDA